MFTGIVEEIGEVVYIRKAKGSTILEISTKELANKANIGDSVAVNGVCLTVVEKKNYNLCFEVILETLKNTNLINISKTSKVNLESSLSAGKDISGHFITGHIDGVGKILNKEIFKNQVKMSIQVPSKLMKFIASKGSICVDGVSLTVAEISNDSFGVYLTPYTLTNTTFKQRKINDYVNIEVDLIAKYLDRIVSRQKGQGIDRDFLKKYGFL